MRGCELNEISPGHSFGDYEILDVVGTGGMGIVYRARQKSLDRIVALKVIRPEIAREEEFGKRFLREARLASSIDHPNVVAIYDAGDIEGRLFLSMQWIEGEDLQGMIATGGALTPGRARDISGQVSAAVDAVHAAGLLHRDIKPANVLIRRVSGKDHAYLTDFGIARNGEADGLTKTGLTVGTPGYGAPEQLRGERPDAASDLYALACVSFELFTGRPPFVGENAMALQWASANDPRPLASAVNSDLDDRYDEFFVRALAIDPSERFASANEYSANLERAQSRESLSAPGSTSRTQASGADHPATAIDRPLSDLSPKRARTTPATAVGAGAGGDGARRAARSRGGSVAAIIALGLVAVVGLTVGVLAAAGMFNSGNASGSRELAAAKKAAAAQKKKASAAEDKLRAARAQARRNRRAAAQTQAAAATSPSSSTTMEHANSGAWPSGTSAWTVVLASVGSSSEAKQTSDRAMRAGLTDVGVLLSSEHRSLRPGYWVAYTGVMTKAESVDRQSQARRSGFSDAYARYVSAY